MSELQRSRLLGAAVGAVGEFGYANASVARITARAGVSRRTFYELFEHREECMIAVLDNASELISSELLHAGLDGLSWRERIRMGVWVILSFFEREPVLARVCVVEALRGGPVVLARREGMLTLLVAIVDEGRSVSKREAQLSPLVAEGLVGAAFSILYTRLLREDSEHLTDLFGEMVGLIVLPYLGPAAALREQVRPAPATLVGQEKGPILSDQFASDPLQGISIRFTYRTTRVLECVAAHPGVSNRQLGEHAGISDQGQVSKLLARLQRHGLLINTYKGYPKGHANAWQLSTLGERVAQNMNVWARNQNGIT